MTILLFLLAMAVGVVGTVVPGIPGLILVWFVALVWGLMEGFGGGGTVAFVVITILSIIGSVSTYVIPPKKASDAGAAWTSILLGVVLALVGLFAIPVVGLFIGGIGGIYLGERLRSSDHDLAYRSTRATIIGLGIGIAIELAAALACIAVWLAWVFLG
jgi:uncharacterized protein